MISNISYFNNSYEGMFIGFLICILLLPALYLLVLRVQKKRDNENYSFLNYFPYEGAHRGQRYILSHIYFFEFLAICTGIMPGLYVFFVLKEMAGVPQLTYMIAQIVISAIAGSCFFVLTLYPVSKPKLHLSVFFTMLVAGILKSAMGAKILFDIKAFSESTTAYVIAFILLVITASLFVVLMNPNLNHWDRMDKITHEDGTITYERPKRFVLALSEWIIFALCWISDILFIIGAYAGIIGK